ncbi:MAG: enoyl-CoA hydratase/isomerase family protein [Chloroflexi bacterium]|nr:enoyl-CoA hydratase/isomerase family protein [Chloroflexota bacterium]
MEFGMVTLEKEGKVGRLTLNRPQLLNAVNMQGTRDVEAAAQHIAADPDLRVVVVTGAGERSFSTGIDLKELSGDKIDMTYHHHWENGLRIIETCDKVFIAAINGWCLGGGLQLALACDLRAARVDATFGLPAIKECLIPGLGVYRLPRYIGMGRAKRLVITGENVDAPTAQAWGMVDHVYPVLGFEQRVAELTASVLKSCSMGSRQSKILTAQAFEYDFEAFLEKYWPAQALTMSHPDAVEARKAYWEKRDPVYS